ncbi:MAG: arylsulfotransferase family protein [Bacteroidetes bacterium]|nr:arylsulfotransferase family protein [Bacteroidota bacterium]
MTALFSAWSVFHVYDGEGVRFGENISQKILSFASIPSTINKFIKKVFNESFFVDDRTFVYDSITRSGFTFSKSYLDEFKGINILIPTYNHIDRSSVIRLFDLDNISLKHEWVIRDKKMNEIDKYKGNNFYRLSHPILLDNNSIITQIISPDNNSISLLKIDSNSNIIWSLSLLVNHSMELDKNNNLWVCGNFSNKTALSFIPDTNLPEDAIWKIDIKTGKIIYEKSIAEILYQNGYDYLFSIGKYEYDLFHLNDVQPALNTTKYWKEGDLLVSLRNKNTIFLYRPSTNKIIWLKIGPWSNQHDCDFVDSSKILVFGNDIIRHNKEKHSLIRGTNNAYVFDLQTGLVSRPYTSLFSNNKIKTTIEGRCDLLPKGNLFVEETINGRLLIGDTNNIKLVYVDRINKKAIRRFFWSRIVTDDEINNLNKIK